MPNKISPRIADYVNALPLAPGLRVLEVGCGPGVAAREVSRRIGDGLIVAIDRSAKAISLAEEGSRAELQTGRLQFRNIAVENFELPPGEEPFDIAFAMRVGALDGRHAELEKQARARLKAALKPEGLLIIDSREPVRGRDIEV
ncbi:class I SAM-dependent methyltransferase [Roseibium salinum]|uniref:Class I SAM-dependent methyltransferase n=1 Tax=Roseibium salinum TaxID=1604349 RepID=A0ABT3QZ05_9HYPH|nr:class I SAM-dependent methyltransferase [Roseibium sp. DSM 29163]MCX2722188.1 class I SAM-dependent methyltransferase [Roseibium sp. DSM 29163]